MTKLPRPKCFGIVSELKVETSFEYYILNGLIAGPCSFLLGIDTQIGQSEISVVKGKPEVTFLD